MISNLDEVFERWFAKIRNMERDIKKLEGAEKRLLEKVAVEELKGERYKLDTNHQFTS